MDLAKDFKKSRRLISASKKVKHFKHEQLKRNVKGKKLEQVVKEQQKQIEDMHRIIEKRDVRVLDLRSMWHSMLLDKHRVRLNAWHLFKAIEGKVWEGSAEELLKNFLIDILYNDRNIEDMFTERFDEYK